ncbi:hypothetical protein B0T24DRAFT_319256 [Lasiosphaeria ovina]|uniref:Uncharacterized protein n=1 Tax=Lasiosphaeria ovina TaxID=92902 RepID=A0AAE0K796_9PEZI|nr:hypothetical protein B0T24DRAFT_319256 [Lasiosphaeria ovina]
MLVVGCIQRCSSCEPLHQGTLSIHIRKPPSLRSTFSFRHLLELPSPSCQLRGASRTYTPKDKKTLNFEQGRPLDVSYCVCTECLTRAPRPNQTASPKQRNMRSPPTARGPSGRLRYPTAVSRRKQERGATCTGYGGPRLPQLPLHGAISPRKSPPRKREGAGALVLGLPTGGGATVEVVQGCPTGVEQQPNLGFLVELSWAAEQ